MPRGYDRPLYILPFDHRASFQKGLFGWSPPLDAAQVAQVAGAKQVIYEGFKRSLDDGEPKQKTAILVDEQFGAAILKDAAAEGFTTCCCVEKSGQDEFEFEYGDAFAEHIEAMRPTFSKVLVRYNPDGDPALNRRQTERLRRLSDYLAAAGRSRFMIELLVPPLPAQLEKVGDDKAVYDVQVRPGLMVRVIRELQDAGIEPDVWKTEGLDRRDDCESIVAAARAGGRASVGCIVLGRGESPEHVRSWLSIAASVRGFIGFAVGRTVFWDPLVAWRAGTLSAEGASGQIEQRFRDFIHLYETTANARAA